MSLDPLPSKTRHDWNGSPTRIYFVFKSVRMPQQTYTHLTFSWMNIKKNMPCTLPQTKHVNPWTKHAFPSQHGDVSIAMLAYGRVGFGRVKFKPPMTHWNLDLVDLTSWLVSGCWGVWVHGSLLENSWRIIPGLGYVVRITSLIYKPFSWPFGRGTTLLRELTNHGY